ncbi:MAG: AraC family transcriptional regulator [Planctomycetes bacterium]|nr:AraC family transcriptional regulator [Planctomycetota bacterium]
MARSMRRSGGTGESTPLIGPCPVQAVSGVWRFTREPGGLRLARSLPGHLLHLVVSGSYDLRTNERAYRIRRGDVIYYHESEAVEWRGNATRVVFYSVGFVAPSWPPLPPERRVFPSTPELRRGFERIHAASRLARDAERALQTNAALLDVLCLIDARVPRHVPGAHGDPKWWTAEQAVRERGLFRPTLEALGGLASCGRATIVRACRRTTGQSPLQRMRQIRMEEARGLLLYSGLNVSQVAEYLGYPRLHEFSREFARYYGRPPSQVHPHAPGHQ